MALTDVTCYTFLALPGGMTSQLNEPLHMFFPKVPQAQAHKPQTCGPPVLAGLSLCGLMAM